MKLSTFLKPLTHFESLNGARLGNRTGARPLFLGLLFAGVLTTTLAAAERINHEGRMLGPTPVVTSPTLFNTPEADAILSAVQLFPVDSAWNEDISRRPVVANSDAIIAMITSELSSSRRTLRPFYEMNYVLVAGDQPMVPIDFFNYEDESDPSPYPLPANLPVETWPRETGDLTLDEWQRDVNDEGGDRHSIVVQPTTGGVWETWLTKRVGSSWEASNGAKFDLNSNSLRPAGWTSGDAAGLSMFAGLVRYDECDRGMVEHAIRIIVKHTRREYVYPANHYASVPSTTDPNVPAMGQRLRLKSSFVIPGNWTTQEKAVLKALKKYGAIVADNGNFFSISVAPDDRFPAEAFDHLSSVGIGNFEVIQSTGPTDGPRSPGAPSADAGRDQSVAPNQPLQLQGYGAATLPAVHTWTVYAGDGVVQFDDAAKTNAVATFSAPGSYTLMLSADDAVHAVAYDAVVIQVTDAIQLRAVRIGSTVQLNWTGGSGPYDVEAAPLDSDGTWNTLMTTQTNTVSFPLADDEKIFRVRGRN